MTTTEPALTTAASREEAEEDPFAGIADEPAAQAADVIRDHLSRARRNYAELNRDWIQKSRKTAGPRKSFLSDFVRQRRETALEAMLLLHSLEPVLRGGEPIPMAVWGAMLSEATGHRVSANSASKAFSTLDDMKLARRTRRGHQTLIEPLAEDGSGADWQRTGARSTPGQGYFTLPFHYWTSGLAGELRLPGKAMLLILLADTQYKPAANIPIEKVPTWYGLSERTAERGYRELNQVGLLLVKRQRVANPRIPGGFHDTYHRALRAPYSSQARKRSQAAALDAGTRRRGTADTSNESPKSQ